MPTPRWNPGGVTTNAMPNVRVSEQAPAAEAFGGGEAAKGVGQALGVVEEVVLREKAKADQIAVTAADTEAAALKTKLFYDPKEGAMTRKGKDAVGAMSDYDAEYGKQLSQISEKLSNGAQRAAFMQRAGQHKADFGMQLEKHASVEVQRYDMETSESRIAVAQNDAVMNFTDPQAISRNIYAQKETVQQLAERQGWSPEKTKQEMDVALSRTHAAVIDRMITTGQDLMAEEYLKTNKAEIGDARYLKAAESQVMEGATLGFAQRKADEIMQKGASLSNALKEAESIESPAKRKAYVAEVQTRFSQKKAAREEAQNNIFDRSSNMLEQNGGDINDIKKSKAWLAMDMGNRQSLENRAKQIREGVPPSTNWNKYYEMKTVASSPATRSEFLKTNLTKLRTEMADTEFKELVNLQTKLREGGDADELLGGYRTMTQIVAGTAKAVGIKDPENVELFQRSVDEQIRVTQTQTGKKATQEDVQRIVDNLVTEGVTKKGWIWDTKKRAYEVDDGEGFTVEYAGVPKSEKRRIEQALKNKNIPVTEETIASLYNAKINKGRKSNAD